MVDDMTKGISITLPKSTLASLEAFYRNGDYPSRSAALTVIIDEYLSSRTKEQVG